MKRTRDDRGAVAVEFGILLPVLLLILLGIIDFGRAYYAKNTLTQAAREGARLEALGNYDASRVVAAAAGLDGVSPAVYSACPGDDAIVDVTYTFTFTTPVGAFGAMFGGGGYGDPIEMSARGVMPCES